MSILELAAALLLLVFTLAVAVHAAVCCIKERDGFSGGFCVLFVAMGLVVIDFINKAAGL